MQAACKQKQFALTFVVKIAIIYLYSLIMLIDGTIISD